MNIRYVVELSEVDPICQTKNGSLLVTVPQPCGEQKYLRIY
jgi:hypothetical protein